MLKSCLAALRLFPMFINVVVLAGLLHCFFTFSSHLNPYRVKAPRSLSINPMSHTAGMNQMLYTLLIGGEVVMLYMKKFDPEMYLSTVEKYKVRDIF